MSARNTGGLARDVEILEVLARAAEDREGGTGVTQVAGRLGREKSQVSRALSSLAAEGLVERDDGTRTYRLGWRLYALAARTQEARLLAVARPVLRRVVARVEETTVLCVLRGTLVLTIASESPPHVFRGLGWEGVGVSAAATSAGRVLLLDWDEDAVHTWFTPERLATAGTRPRFATADALVEELRRIRERGYATVDEEFEVGVVGCSAPVRDTSGAVVAALNITAPRGRFGDRLDAAGRYLARRGEELSAAMTSSGPRS